MDMSRISKKPVSIILPIGIFSLVLGVASPAIFGVITRNSSILDRGWFSWMQQQNGTNNQSVGRLSLSRIPDSLDFCGERVPLEIPDVRERMEQAFYTELSDAQIILDLKRSTMYFPFIEQKLHDMNMPTDLRYLPVAESALRNLVSSKNAAGIWQFTDDTARRYGLVVNEQVDERFNFHKATEAALRFLNDLHSTFGSWSLVAASYNMGSSGIKASLDYQMVSNYYSLYLNDETYRFVFRIVALKEILSHYEEYGFALAPVDFYQFPETKLIVVTRIPDLATWARQQGSSYKEVKYLNPWIINHSLAAGTWAIELPKYAQRVTFTSPFPVIDTVIDSTDPIHPEQNGLTYVVKRGDTLEKIAVIYGVSVKDIEAWNNLKDKSRLQVGKKLKILIGDSEPDQ
jgi:hypothetical protein